MRVTFWCDNGANSRSKREDTFDLEDIGISEEEWSKMTEDQKLEEVQIWASEKFSFGFDEEH